MVRTCMRASWQHMHLLLTFASGPGQRLHTGWLVLTRVRACVCVCVYTVYHR